MNFRWDGICYLKILMFDLGLFFPFFSESILDFFFFSINRCFNSILINVINFLFQCLIVFSDGIFIFCIFLQVWHLLHKFPNLWKKFVLN